MKYILSMFTSHTSVLPVTNVRAFSLCGWVIKLPIISSVNLYSTHKLTE